MTSNYSLGVSMRWSEYPNELSGGSDKCLKCESVKGARSCYNQTNRIKLLWIRHQQKLTLATARDLNADVGFDEVARTRLVEEVQRDADE